MKIIENIHENSLMQLTKIIAAICLILCSSITTYSQVDFDDFKIHGDKIKVKSRTITYVGDNSKHYNTIFYNESGEVIKYESRDASHDSSATTRSYIKDSTGKLIASIDCISYTSFSAKSSLVNNGRRDTIRTFYNYDKNNKLSNTVGTQNGYSNKAEYTNEGKVKKVTWLDSIGKVLLVMAITYDEHLFQIKREITSFQEGKVTEVKLDEYKNEYDDEGKLLSRNFKGNKCSDKSTFRYYRNGLVKGIYGNKCNAEWRVKYTFYEK
jgi:hypothetical protein